MQSPLYCVLNRHYVTPRTKKVALDLASYVAARFPGTVTLALDAGFPFLDGFPLLPIFRTTICTTVNCWHIVWDTETRSRIETGNGSELTSAVAWIPEPMMEAAPVKELVKGEYLFHQGEMADGIYAVERGRMRLSFHSADGHEALVHIARPGDLIIESTLFVDTYHCDASATENSRLRVFEKDTLCEVLQSKPQTCQRFMEVLVEQLRLLRARMENRNIRSARERLIHYIIIHGGSDGRAIELESNLKELALDLGMTHETLYRALAVLEKNGTIERTPHAITLVKKP